MDQTQSNPIEQLYWTGFGPLLEPPTFQKASQKPRTNQNFQKSVFWGSGNIIKCMYVEYKASRIKTDVRKKLHKVDEILFSVISWLNTIRATSIG